MRNFFQKQKIIHKQVLIRLVEMIATATIFIVMFVMLLMLSNWPAYSRIIQDTLDFNAVPLNFSTSSSNSSLNNIFSPTILKEKSRFTLSEIGPIYPEGMRLEVPSVFDSIIPLQHVQKKDFTFQNYYDSENEIQKALREGAVHYPFTAYPDQYGNVFITGHSSYYPWDKGKYKEIFAMLYKLTKGDQYFIYYKGKKYTYQVFDIFEVLPDDISVLDQPVDRKISTLMTCTPVGTTLRRLIVKAELIKVI